MPFTERHLGQSQSEIADMLAAIGAKSLDELIDKTVPGSIRKNQMGDLPLALEENDFLTSFKKMMSQNQIKKNFVGMGYYGTLTPSVILRNILENPAWYTAYTPYQPEIAQGRLEMLLNFQTMVSDLTGMELANASLLDEATAAAEAASMSFALRDKKKKKQADTVMVDENTHPQTIDLIKTRMEPMGHKVVVAKIEDTLATSEEVFSFVLSYPGSNGHVQDFEGFIGKAHEAGALVIMCTDLLALTQLKSPGEMDADIVVGCAQRFGVPLGYGGPHAAFMAARDKYKRQIPGRIIGVSEDRQGNRALRMALQTREQHIKREKATSNICTAQVLLAVMSAAYAIYHGPDRILAIAQRTNSLASQFANTLKKAGFTLISESFVDTVGITLAEDKKEAYLQKLDVSGINVRTDVKGCLLFSFDETHKQADVEELITILTEATGLSEANATIPKALQRTSGFMEHEVFHNYHTEHEMLRYLKRLENKDLSLVHSMIALGSCTMKLNATTEMIPLSWPELANIHPFAPKSQAKGYHDMMDTLGKSLCAITGFDGISFQPNSGAQGEYAGLMVIRALHKDNGQSHRNIVLIPSSAHGTNPATAVMVGMKVVVVACDEKGNIDMGDLKAKAELHSENLAALMVTYPSTHGVFEEAIQEICALIHQHGGRVYMDGANMNAQVGLTSPGAIGADVCHLNLHKTFCIPHGGGGPGMGPICCTAELAAYLPGHPIIDCGGEKAISAVSAGPYGSTSILSISYAYIAMMGNEGLTEASRLAILNANYVKARLKKGYDVLYEGENGHNAHEVIVDFRAFKKSANIEAADIAKRLIDYGFHSPTLSFPVAGTIMIEPTESESKAELDRFCDAMLMIRQEIKEIEEGSADQEDNVLKNAPHTAQLVTANEWNYPYTRQKAAYPLPYVSEYKFWPTVSRINEAQGDRNLICTCLPIEEYAQMETFSK